MDGAENMQAAPEQTAVDPNAENKSLTSELGTLPGIVEHAKKRMMEKNADLVLQIMEERDKLSKALTKYDKWLKRLGDGDISVIKEYKKKRSRLEEDEDVDFN